MVRFETGHVHTTRESFMILGHMGSILSRRTTLAEKTSPRNGAAMRKMKLGHEWDFAKC